MHFLTWAVEGVIAGWLIAQIMLSEGRYKARDILTGIAGGVIGGFLASVTHSLARSTMTYNGLAAVLGGMVLMIPTVLIRDSYGKPRDRV